MSELERTVSGIFDQWVRASSKPDAVGYFCFDGVMIIRCFVKSLKGACGVQ